VKNSVVVTILLAMRKHLA